MIGEELEDRNKQFLDREDKVLIFLFLLKKKSKENKQKHIRKPVDYIHSLVFGGRWKRSEDNNFLNISKQTNKHGPEKETKFQGRK